jgi:hypothetical protein
MNAPSAKLTCHVSLSCSYLLICVQRLAVNNERKNLLSSLGIIKISERTIRRRFIDPLCEQGDEHCFRRAGSYGCGPHLPVGCGLLLVSNLETNGVE